MNKQLQMKKLEQIAEDLKTIEKVFSSEKGNTTNQQIQFDSISKSLFGAMMKVRTAVIFLKPENAKLLSLKEQSEYN